MQLQLFAADQLPPLLSTEVWRDILDFPGYQCSSGGRFRNTRDDRILTGNISANGYVHIGLQKNGRQVWKLAHRLVAVTFLPPPPHPSLCLVNHLNRSRHDNAASNLEWSSYSRNASHAWNAKKDSSPFPGAPMEDERVPQLTPPPGPGVGTVGGSK